VILKSLSLFSLFFILLDSGYYLIVRFTYPIPKVLNLFPLDLTFECAPPFSRSCNPISFFFFFIGDCFKAFESLILSVSRTSNLAMDCLVELGS
jgi:hypothetical protein